MTVITFDTLMYAKKLEKAGFSPEQAEVQAETLKEIVENNQKSIEENIATKKDLKETETVLRHELDLKIAELKSELIKWMLGFLVAQSAIIISCIKLIHS